MKLEKKSVIERTFESFSYFAGSPTPPVKTPHPTFNKVTAARKRSDFTQARKESSSFWPSQLTSTFQPQLGAEPHQLQRKASKLARREYGSEPGEVGVAGLPPGVVAE